MLDPRSKSVKKYKWKIYSIASQRRILLYKEGEKLYYRSGFVVLLRPLQIPDMYHLIDLFQKPSQVIFETFFLTFKTIPGFLTAFFLETNLSNCPKKDYNDFLTTWLHYHKDNLKILHKSIAMKGIVIKELSRAQLADLGLGIIQKSIKKYGYKLETEQDNIIFKAVAFSHPSIKHIEYNRHALIPPCTIPLGMTMNNKEIGVNSHVLFLTGEKERRRSLLKTLVTHYTQQDQYHIIIFDFGLNIQLERTFFREFRFEDIFLDPFSFKKEFTPSQQSLFISHLSFMGRTILRLNERQIGLLEGKLSAYFDTETKYSWTGFLKFAIDESADNLLTHPAGLAAFTTDTTTAAFANSLKATEDPMKTAEGESLMHKLRYLDHLFAHQTQTSLEDLLVKNHLDIFRITTPPDLKSLFFYLFNLFYCLHETAYQDFKCMFLAIDALFFDRFTEIDLSWVHAHLKQSLFDSSEIFPVKKLYNQLETRVYTSYTDSSQSTLTSKATKEAIDQLQILHDYVVLESPTLQQPEYFKLLADRVIDEIDLPSREVFEDIMAILFSDQPSSTFDELFVYFDIDRRKLKRLRQEGYLEKVSRKYQVTEKAEKLKKTLINYLSYQPVLSLEDTATIEKYSDPVRYNIIFQKEFDFEGNIDLLCTRYLADQLTHTIPLDYYLAFYYVHFKQHTIDEQKLLYFFLVAIQARDLEDLTEAPEQVSTELTSEAHDPENIIEPVIEAIEQPIEPPSKVDLQKEYFEVQRVEEPAEQELQEKELDTNSTLLTHGDMTFPAAIQEAVDAINTRIHAFLPDSSYSFPENPIFLIMKFLPTDVAELLFNDLQHLINVVHATAPAY